MYISCKDEDDDDDDCRGVVGFGVGKGRKRKENTEDTVDDSTVHDCKKPRKDKTKRWRKGPTLARRPQTSPPPGGCGIPFIYGRRAMVVLSHPRPLSKDGPGGDPGEDGGDDSHHGGQGGAGGGGELGLCAA